MLFSGVMSYLFIIIAVVVIIIIIITYCILGYWDETDGKAVITMFCSDMFRASEIAITMFGPVISCDPGECFGGATLTIYLQNCSSLELSFTGCLSTLLTYDDQNKFSSCKNIPTIVICFHDNKSQ